MKKIKFIFCLIMFVLLLISCGHVDSENKEDNRTPCITYIEPYSVREQYEYAKNVYEAELIDFKYYNEDMSREKSGNFLITVKISFVYKGEYLPGNAEIQDVLCYYELDYPLKIGAKYLFMTGWDDDYQKNDNPYIDSVYQAVERVGNDDFINYNGKKSTPHKNYFKYSDLIYDMLNLKEIGESYGFRFAEKVGNEFNYLSLDALYVLADNAYIGEIIEIESQDKAKIIVEGYSEWWGECDIAKIKVKVLTVLKGNYVPGQIVEDIIPIYIPYNYNLDGFLCFSGDNFFEGYNEMLEDNKSA